MKNLTTFEFSDYIEEDGEVLKATVLATMGNQIHWRRDSSNRIPGGRKRTVAPKPRNLLDRIVAGGGSELTRAVRLCSQAANVIMQQEMEFPDWQANRVGINVMPAGSKLPEHVDPPYFRDGVVVVGLGQAEFCFTNNTRHWAGRFKTGQHSIMYIPPDWLHDAESLEEEERVVLAISHDDRLDAGRGITHQFAADLVHRILYRDTATEL